jgi:hypothetical protein
MIGLNEAIALQQLYYWLERTDNNRDGRYWVYNTYQDWQAQLPWCSLATIRRTFASLERQGLILTATFNRSAMDHTRWYTIDFEVLEALLDAGPATREPCVADTPATQQSAARPTGPMIDSPRAHRSAQDEQMDDSECTHPLISLINPVPESTPKNTQRDSVPARDARAARGGHSAISGSSPRRRFWPDSPPGRAVAVDQMDEANLPVTEIPITNDGQAPVLPQPLQAMHDGLGSMLAIDELVLSPSAALRAALETAGLATDPYLRGAMLLGWHAATNLAGVQPPTLVIGTLAPWPAVITARLQPRLDAGLSTVIGRPVRSAIVMVEPGPPARLPATYAEPPSTTYDRATLGQRVARYG